jgi:hypothetical protein
MPLMISIDFGNLCRCKWRPLRRKSRGGNVGLRLDLNKWNGSLAGFLDKIRSSVRPTQTVSGVKKVHAVLGDRIKAIVQRELPPC